MLVLDKVPVTPTSSAQKLRSEVETALAATVPDAHALTADELATAGYHLWTGDVSTVTNAHTDGDGKRDGKGDADSDTWPGATGVHVGSMTLDFAPTTGAIVGLTTPATTSTGARQWSSADMPLGLLRHAGWFAVSLLWGTRQTTNLSLAADAVDCSMVLWIKGTVLQSYA